MKRKTTRPRKRPRQSVLEVRVMSPRIAWHNLLKFLGNLFKFACILTVISGIGWGIWRGVQHTFHENPDFRLQLVDLNSNPVIDEAQVIQLANIDLSAAPSLFDINIKQTEAAIDALPAIIDCHVERHLPGTLVIRVTCRKPKAWVTLEGEDHPLVREVGGTLLDIGGVPYPCPARQLEEAKNLPIVQLSKLPEHPIILGKAIDHPELEHCFNLIASALEADEASAHWIQSVHQHNEWSLMLVTRQGTAATFGLSDHERQIENLRAAMDHAGQKGYIIDTINLIPKFNIPITVRGNKAPPKAIPVSQTGTSTGNPSLNNLSNRD